MGVINISRENVTEWLQPAPLTVVGVAAVVVDALGELAADVFSLADVVPDCAAATVVVLAGDAAVDPFGDVQFFPSPVALAEIVLDGTSPSDDVNLTAGIALADIRGPATLDSVEVVGEAGVVALTQILVAVSSVGEAQVSFEYYGDGNFPIFPFKLPALFTDNPQNIQDAAAYVAVSGVGELDAVSGVAAAVVGFTGDVVLTRRGSTPIFPFALPVVFDDPANIQVGSATLVFQMGAACVVDVIGESAVALDGAGISYGSAVFPWTFPVALVAA